MWVYELSKEFTFETPNVVLEEIPKTLNGKTFVVTGSVNHYKNRDELKADMSMTNRLQTIMLSCRQVRD